MRVPFSYMESEFRRILIKKGCSQAVADEAARSFTNTSCDGIYSHGVNRFPRVIRYIEKGYIRPDAMPEKKDAFGALERWDGNLGLGNLIAKRSMNRAIELADEYGIGCVALRNNNHWMRGGEYGWQAANKGYIGISWTNTLPNMPAWGAIDQRIGNNPLILALPRKKGNVVVDLALSQFSYGKIEEYKFGNQTLPVPGGYDSDGNLTKNPKEIKGVLPIGFWKGSGLSIVLDLMAAMLANGNTTNDIGKLGDDEYAVSQVFIAISPLGSLDEIEELINESVEYIKNSHIKNEADGVYYPGERSAATRKENLKLGIPVDEDVWKTIQSM
ncbi:3-dehydro-L-gulonate 2-dehydrogenase [Lentibacillus persicus]|uniref:3-dehydro-L-gulonate 2-dehydrogenase n=1 Tax=Lentibacillus persicus TaxID=640948 RepID=A0A1I1YPQ7_9BACI|nr:3-dehydro-L-gulonate 2-dehydrogenase [Lentibacillus persicus]SFE21487.1 3-dehydro-L-gulonate 2-dehydrogenase [Lentibacillus persicus]